MECCTFLFIYLLVHTSIQQVRRENANDAGTARQRGPAREAVERPWRNALAANHPVVLIVLVVIVEAELLHNRGWDALQVDKRLFTGSPNRPSLCLVRPPSIRRSLAAWGGIGPI